MTMAHFLKVMEKSQRLNTRLCLFHVVFISYFFLSSSHDCPVPTCKAPKRRKHKRKLRLLPAKWRELAPEVKEPIIKELGEQRKRESLSVCLSVCLSVIVCLFVWLNCLYMRGWAHTHTWNNLPTIFLCQLSSASLPSASLSPVPYSYVLCA